MKNIFVGNSTSIQVKRTSGDRDTDQPRGFGFVEMASAEDGIKDIAALNGALLGDRALNVNEARPRPQRSHGGQDAGSVEEAAHAGKQRGN